MESCGVGFERAGQGKDCGSARPEIVELGVDKSMLAIVSGAAMQVFVGEGYNEVSNS